MRIIFAGTPDFSVPTLEALIHSGHEICAVYSQPDRPSGRGRKLMPGPVKSCALEHNLSVYQPVNFKDETASETLLGLNADLMVVVAYGLILPRAILEAPARGCVNIHASLLPRWRGAAPIQRAILEGDTESGITLMQMDVGLDTGDMFAKTKCAIEARDTGSKLHDKLATLGAKLLIENLEDIEKGNITLTKQDESLVSYAHKLTKHEASIDWNAPATKIRNQIMAFNAWPVAHTNWGEKRLRIWQAALESKQNSAVPGTVIRANKEGICVATGEGTLVLTQVQLPGGRPLAAADFLNAHNLDSVRFT